MIDRKNPCCGHEEQKNQCENCMFYKVAMKNENVKRIIEYAKKEADKSTDFDNKARSVLIASILIENELTNGRTVELA